MAEHFMELLCPAGNMDKLKMAIRYGADAVIVFGVELSDGSDQPYCCLASVDYCNPLEQRISLRSV